MATCNKTEPDATEIEKKSLILPLRKSLQESNACVGVASPQQAFFVREADRPHRPIIIGDTYTAGPTTESKQTSIVNAAPTLS